MRRELPQLPLLYRAAPLVIAAAAVVIRFAILRATHSTTEDFLITLRYAQNLAHGNGFVYNGGERVLGTTTPLYTLILAGAAFFHLDAILFGKALNILAEGCTCWLIARLLFHFGRPTAGLLAPVLYATSTAPISISIGGMETGLVTLACTAAIYTYLLRRPYALAGSLAILLLLRIDGLLLFALLGVGWALQRERSEAQAAPAVSGFRRFGPALLFLALVLPWLVFAFLYFGSPVPASMTAKMAVYARLRPGLLPNLADFRTQFAAGAVQLVLLALFMIGAATVWLRHARIRPALLWLTAYYAAMLFSRVPAFPWYFLPPLPVYYGCATYGLARLADGLACCVAWLRPGSESRRRIALAAVCVAAAPLLVHLRSVQRDITMAQRVEDEVRKPLGLWLAANADPNDRVLLEPIGYIGCYSGLPVLDMIGLVSPEVIPCYSSSIPNPLREIVHRFRPQLLVLRTEEAAQLGGGGTEGEKVAGGEYLLTRVFKDAAGRPVFFIYRRVEPPDALRAGHASRGALE